MNESVLSFKDKYFGDKNFYKMTLTIAVPHYYPESSY